MRNVIYLKALWLLSSMIYLKNVTAGRQLRVVSWSWQENEHSKLERVSVRYDDDSVTGRRRDSNCLRSFEKTENVNG